MSGGGEVVGYEGEELTVTAKDGHVAVAHVPGLVFAAPLRTDGHDEVVAVARVEEPQARIWSLVAFRLEGGMFGYGRMLFGASQKLGRGNLLYGGEAYHDDGPWTHPDNYYKFNGLLTWSQGGDDHGFSITARGYHGTWHSSDQIPVPAVPVVGLF